MVDIKGSGNTKVDGSISFVATPSSSSCEDIMMMQTKCDIARDDYVRVIWPSLYTLILIQLTMDASECKAQPVDSTTSRQIVHSELIYFTT